MFANIQWGWKSFNAALTQWLLSPFFYVFQPILPVGQMCNVGNLNKSDYTSSLYILYPISFLTHTPSVHSVIEHNYRMQLLFQAAASQRTSALSTSALCSSYIPIPTSTSDAVTGFNLLHRTDPFIVCIMKYSAQLSTMKNLISLSVVIKFLFEFSVWNRVAVINVGRVLNTEVMMNVSNTHCCSLPLLL